MESKDMSAMEILSAACNNPHLIGEKHNRPIFGYLTMHVPVELIYAADILPVRIQGGRTADLASNHLQSFTCSYARAAIHQALRGDYDYLDGVIAAKTCDVVLGLYHSWSTCRPLKFSWLISLPGNSDREAITYFHEELAALKTAIETYRGIEISDQRLLDAISLYNQIRDLLSQLWAKRDEGILPLSAGDLIKVIKGSQVLDPRVVLDLLSSLLGDVEKEGGMITQDVRLMILGNTYEDISLVEMIEKSGGWIAFDDTTAMGRLFGSPVELDGEGPLGSLAHHYVSKVTGPYRLTFERRWEHILNLIQRWRINGCIHVIQKYCDTALFESPLIVESLRALGIPSLILEIDDTSLGLNQIRTRVEAFVEMIGGI
ncbi:MAG: 2-hydroxyacyl-CoA dehydratase family protein [Pseudomonadota bacterium]